MCDPEGVQPLYGFEIDETFTVFQYDEESQNNRVKPFVTSLDTVMNMDVSDDFSKSEVEEIQDCAFVLNEVVTIMRGGSAWGNSAPRYAAAWCGESDEMVCCSSSDIDTALFAATCRGIGLDPDGAAFIARRCHWG